MTLMRIGIMRTVDVTPNQKGSIGEALIFKGQIVPRPISKAIEEFVKKTYDVAESTSVSISAENGMYLKASIGDGKSVSTFTDGGFSTSWIPKRHEREITRSPEGYVRNRRDLEDESAFFPAEVKTGRYAELERDQRETLETVASSNTRQHPVLVRVQIEKLPEQYEISTRFL